MNASPRGIRIRIGIFGRRNVGKSSLMNALTRQNVSLVSETAGTTTDPVEKPMEILPLGPVVFTDTAGIDDDGAVGSLRVARTHQVFDRTDIGIVVAEPHAEAWGEYEEQIIEDLRRRSIPALVAFNKSDLIAPVVDTFRADLASRGIDLETRGIPFVRTSAATGAGIDDLREALVRAAPEELINPPSILGDLVPAGEMAVLVVPIDMEAPKGRLILPQVQTIRDILDADAFCMVVKERELGVALGLLHRPPALVVTDSQAFLKVAADTPADIPMTSFSILFSRWKGDLAEFVRGALQIESLRPGDRVLVAESCTHHPVGDDIGRVKIPRWLTQYVGGRLEFTTVQGRDFPEDLGAYRLVVQCGGCMFTRREMLSRILACRRACVPITNYGMAIAYSLGVFERALAPFPAARAVLEASSGSTRPRG
jgi:[FeFe] hydrogenase H-cluster maturation GTPase HydF